MKPAKNELQYVRVYAPATVANMVCGFDVLGFALEEPGDEVEMWRSETPGVRLVEITGDEGKLPLDPRQNTVSSSVMELLLSLGRHDSGLEIKLHKRMPIGSGLGSSAASTIAGLFAANQLLGQPLTAQELLPFALKGEALACGNGHADNVAPCLFGGIQLVRSYEPLEVIDMPVPHSTAGLFVTAIFPHVEVPTREARRLIKERVFLKDAVKQWGNIAGLVSALYQNDLGLLSRSMQDELIEPVRSILIPGFQGMKYAALKAGALSFGISGSGPTVFSLSEGRDRADEIQSRVVEVLRDLGVGYSAYVSTINEQGPRVLQAILN